MKLYFDKKSLTLKAETEEDKQLLLKWNNVLKTNGADIYTEYVEDIFKFEMQKNPIKEKSKAKK